MLNFIAETEHRSIHIIACVLERAVMCPPVSGKDAAAL